jgi:hypothetical protein
MIVLCVVGVVGAVFGLPAARREWLRRRHVARVRAALVVERSGAEPPGVGRHAAVGQHALVPDALVRAMARHPSARGFELPTPRRPRQ